MKIYAKNITCVYVLCVYIPISDVAAIQTLLIKQFKGTTNNVQMMPLDEDEGLPLHEIYESVLLEEDLTSMKRTRKPDEQSNKKLLISVKDMFYVKYPCKNNSKLTFNKDLINEKDGFHVKYNDIENAKFARKIILTGEAGHGKTVLCLKIIDSWSQAKRFQRETDGVQTGESVKTKDKNNKKQTKPTGSELRASGDRVKKTNENIGSSGSEGLNEKSAYLQQRHLQLETTVQGKDEDNILQRCLSFFGLVFFVPLRFAKHGLSSIDDLVCDTVSECPQNVKQKIKQMLHNGEIRSLIILDGLDEWRAPDACRVQGFPDGDDLVNCTLLCTMRPWRMVNLRLGLDSMCDKMIHIRGLQENSVKSVISNVLVNFYGLKISSALYKSKFQCFCEKANLPQLESLMKIPLMLTTSCLVWNEESEISSGRDIRLAKSYFMTFCYLKLTEMTITRAENKHDIVKSFLAEKRRNPNTNPNMPSLLSAFMPIIDFLEIIIPVGRLALQDLMSDEPHLIFPRNTLEREIGWSKVELALKTGILSQTKAPGLSYQQRISVSFYHKSIQEFVAALAIASRDSSALTLFYRQCTTLNNVMELSSMIMCVCGLNPAVGCQISEHIKNVVNQNVDIVKQRLGEENAGSRDDEREEIYQMQCGWFNEMKHNLSYTHEEHIPTLHVTDVHVCGDGYYSNPYSVSAVSVASELVSMEDNSIVSVYLDGVGHPIHSILHNLQGCKNLTSLHIGGIRNAGDTDLLVQVLPKLVNIECLEYGNSKESITTETAGRVVQYLQNLKRLKMYIITLSETLTLPPLLQKVNLDMIDNAHFILQSLPGCTNLTSLVITCLDSMHDCKVLASVMPLLLNLQYIHYDGEYSSFGAAGHATVVSALQHLKQVIHIKLESIDMDDAGYTAGHTSHDTVTEADAE